MDPSANQDHPLPNLPPREFKKPILYTLVILVFLAAVGGGAYAYLHHDTLFPSAAPHGKGYDRATVTSDLYKTLPVYPGSVLVGNCKLTDNKIQQNCLYKTPDGVDKIITWYKNNLSSWTLVKLYTKADGQNYLYNNLLTFSGPINSTDKYDLAINIRAADKVVAVDDQTYKGPFYIDVNLLYHQ